MRLYGNPRLPVDALKAATRAESDSDLARQLGMATSAIQHARTRGLALCNADAWAVRLGLHPANVWCEQWAHASHERDLWLQIPRDLRQARETARKRAIREREKRAEQRHERARWVQWRNQQYRERA